MMTICRHIAVSLLLTFSISSAAETTLIHAGQLLAIPGESPISRQTIVVENNQIREIVDGFADATDFDGDVSVIDLSDHFVLPGLMDMHVHLQFELGPQNERDALKMSDQLKQMRSIHYAMETLLAGFTTVRDVGSSPQEMYAMRDAIEKGWIDGPRIIAAGGVGITGGHADISGVNPELMELFTSPNVCDGPYDCRRAARNVIKYGADWIKITSTGGVMTDRDTGTDQQMEMDELKEIVLAAARMGRKVASLFKETGAYLVPTLLAGKTVVAMAVESDFMSDTVEKKAIRVGNDIADSFEKAHKAGVNIAYGTDSGISRHGTNAEEAVLMVENGMSEMDVLITATVNAADLLDMSDTIGTIEAGKSADIIAVGTSPLENIDALLDVDFVMKSGKVYKN